MRHQNKCENKNVNFLSSPGIGTGRVNKKINFLGERDLKSKFLSSFFIIPIIWLFLRYTQTCLLVFICIHGFIVFPTHEVVNLKKILFEGARTKAREYLFISFDYSADIYLFKQNNRKPRTICKICWKLTIVVNKDANVILLVSLVSTYNKFHTSFWCFYCWIWLWTSACRQVTNFFCFLRFFHKARLFCFLANVETRFKYKWISCSYFY